MPTDYQLKLMDDTEKIIRKNKRIYYDYVRFASIPKVYNRGEVNGDIFTLTRIKDNHVICKFNINTYLPEPINP